jgi:hypoxanthine phosphoribosyltransferase
MVRFEDFDLMIPADAIAARTAELGAQITRDLGPARDIVVVGVLKGSVVFMADLMRYLPPEVTIDFLRLSSYEGGTESTGSVRFDFDLTQPIAGKTVLIVEDIIDTGLTMSFLLEALQVRHPKTIKVCALLDKPARRKKEVPLDYKGFTIEDRFVIGYGLDLEGHYRNLPYVAALKPEIQAKLSKKPH